MADIRPEEQIRNLQAQLSTAHAKISLLEAEHKQTEQTPLRAISGNEMLHFFETVGPRRTTLVIMYKAVSHVCILSIRFSITYIL